MISSNFVFPLALLAVGLVLVVKEPEDAHQENYLQKARRQALRVIAGAKHGSIVVFDFDDTLVRPRNVQTFSHSGNRTVWYGDRKALPVYEPLREMIDVVKYANSRNMHVVIITARVDTETMRSIVRANAQHHGIEVNEIYGFRPQLHSLSTFKAGIRHTLNQSRPVVLTIGDRWPDVNDAAGAHWIKLPSNDGIFRSSLSKYDDE